MTGFSLAWVEGKEANSAKEACKVLKEALDCKDTGIILISERLAKEIQPNIDELMTQKECILILQIPDANGALKGRQSIEEYVLSALGMRVKGNLYYDKIPG